MAASQVPHWSDVAAASQLAPHVWRDLVIKITTRENDIISCAPVNKTGSRSHVAVQQMTEGTMLRLLLALQLLYPFAVERLGELRFRVHSQGPGFAHLEKSIGMRVCCSNTCSHKRVFPFSSSLIPL